MAQEDGADSAAGAMAKAPVPGGGLEYEVSGSGESVLLIHGGVIAATFLPLMNEPALSDYRLVRYHRRGFAGSLEHTGPSSPEQQAADAVAVLEHLGIERAHIVGHSLGGMIALQLALQAPERVGALVLLEAGPLPQVDAGAGNASGSDATAPPPVPQDPPFLAPYREGDIEAAARSFMQFTGGENWPEHLERAGPGAWQQVLADFHVLVDTEMRLGGPAPSDLRSLMTPMLYVIGTETRIGPATAEQLEQAATNLLPNARILLMQDMNHSMQLRDPAAVAAVIRQFLAQHRL